MVKEKLFPDVFFSSNTVFMALRAANKVTEHYPKEFEHGSCQKQKGPMNMTCSPLTKLFVYPARGMTMCPLISSCPAQKTRYCTTLKLMTGLLGKPHLNQCQWGLTISMGGIAKKLQQSRCAGVVY
jgi:hypothetical protein